MLALSSYATQITMLLLFRAKKRNFKNFNYNCAKIGTLSYFKMFIL